MNPPYLYVKHLLLTACFICVLSTLTGQTTPFQYFGDRKANVTFSSATITPSGDITGLIKLDLEGYQFKITTTGELIGVYPLSNFEDELSLNSYALVPYGENILGLGYDGVAFRNRPSRLSSVIFTNEGRANQMCPPTEGTVSAVGGYSRFDVVGDTSYVKLQGPRTGSNSDLVVDFITPNPDDSFGPWGYCDQRTIGQANPNDFLVLSDTIILVDQRINSTNRPIYSSPTFQFSVLNAPSSVLSPIYITDRLPQLDSFFIEAANPDGINDAGLIYVEGMLNGNVLSYFSDLNSNTHYPISYSTNRPIALLESDSTIVYYSTTQVHRQFSNGRIVLLYESEDRIHQVLDNNDPTLPIIIFDNPAIVSVGPAGTINWNKNVFGVSGRNSFYISELFAGNEQSFVKEVRTDSTYHVQYRTLGAMGTLVADSTAQHVWLPRSYRATDTTLLQLEYHEDGTNNNELYVTNREFSYTGSILNENSYILPRPPGTSRGKERGYTNKDKSFFAYFEDGNQQQAYLFNLVDNEYRVEPLPQSKITEDSVLLRSTIQISDTYISIAQLISTSARTNYLLRLTVLDRVTKMKISSRDISVSSNYITGSNLFINPISANEPEYVQVLCTTVSSNGSGIVDALIFDPFTKEISEKNLSYSTPAGSEISSPWLGRPGQQSAIFCADSICYEFDFQGTELVYQPHEFSVPVGHKITSGIVSGHQLYVMGYLTPESTLPEANFYANRTITPLVTSNTAIRDTPELLYIYPSPTTGKVTVTLDHVATLQDRIMVLDIMGKVVRQEIFPGGASTYHFDLSSLSPGIYLVQVGRKSSWVVVEE